MVKSSLIVDTEGGRESMLCREMQRGKKAERDMRLYKEKGMRGVDR